MTVVRIAAVLALALLTIGCSMDGAAVTAHQAVPDTARSDGFSDGAEAVAPENEGLDSNALIALTEWIRDHRAPIFSVLGELTPRPCHTGVSGLHYFALRTTVRSMDATQLLKGALDLMVLAVVEGEDGYGYDVVRRLRAAGFDEVGDASVYGTLRRLYSGGLLASYVVPSESGPHRKYYGITPRGRAQLMEDRRQWQVVDAALHNLWQAVALPAAPLAQGA